MRIRHFTHPQILYDLIRLFQIKGKKAKQKDGKLSIRAQMVRPSRSITTFTLLRYFAAIASDGLIALHDTIKMKTGSTR